ncbi:HpcH/HpaI aldolase/citrate lyase family protein [Ruegeria arenilitoris]|uniref:HpcH/HpaI aldolase/citrate lyase family protein n=1 Tax=Ruegeria arenilitoris TaxID=1173585 RepID=UPI00147EE523|nr:CoA ester lyase [Ruegeria arenilitoris]
MVNTIQVPLFVPATRPERFAKAAASGADAIIVDLEDAVAPADKDAARANVDGSFSDLPVILRINAVGTPWFADDVQALKDRGFSAVMLPKSENLDDINQITAQVPDLPIIALVETAKGLGRAREIAAAPAVTRLAFGSVDFSADLGCEHQRDALLLARSELVLASRIAGISAPLDGVTVEVADPSVSGGDAEHSRALGMTGKMCIHPNQISKVKHAFMPSDVEVEWAQRVLKAAEGAVMIDGEMVDEPVRNRARVILAAKFTGAE